MKTARVTVSTIVIASVATIVFAQGMRRGGGNYNPATETTLTGAVDEVKNVPSQGPGAGGLHLIVKAASGAVEVHLGPAAFVTSKNMTFAKGDTVTVTGSKVTMSGQEVVIAREIKKGDQVLTLRDANGFPAWAGCCSTPR